MIYIDLNPTPRTLRQFGILACLVFGILGAVLYWKKSLWGITFGDRGESLGLAVWGMVVFIAVLSLVAPRLLRPLYVALTLLAFPIGYVVSHVVLALLFYGLLTPFGLLFRVLGRDPLHRRFDKDLESYWVPRRHRTKKESYFRQF